MIHDIFHMLLLKQNTTRKGQINRNVTEFKFRDKEKYEVEEIQDSSIYIKKFEANYLSSLYYLIS